MAIEMIPENVIDSDDAVRPCLFYPLQAQVYKTAVGKFILVVFYSRNLYSLV